MSRMHKLPLFQALCAAGWNLWRLQTLSETLTTKLEYWEIIGDKLSAAGWSWGYCSAITKDGWRWWIVDPHKGDGKRYIVQSDELLSAFLELEAMLL